LIGLTGSKEATTAAAKSYRVYYSKVEETQQDYLIDHSIITYLVDPSGDFVSFYGKNTEAKAMAEAISAQIVQWVKAGNPLNKQ
jgi:protein SCO1/2